MEKNVYLKKRTGASVIVIIGGAQILHTPNYIIRSMDDAETMAYSLSQSHHQHGNRA